MFWNVILYCVFISFVLIRLRLPFKCRFSLFLTNILKHFFVKYFSATTCINGSNSSTLLLRHVVYFDSFVSKFNVNVLFNVNFAWIFKLEQGFQYRALANKYIVWTSLTPHLFYIYSARSKMLQYTYRLMSLAIMFIRITVYDRICKTYTEERKKERKKTDR